MKSHAQSVKGPRNQYYMPLGTAIRLKKFGSSWEFRGLTEFFGQLICKNGSRSIVKKGKVTFKVTLLGVLYSQ